MQLKIIEESTWYTRKNPLNIEEENKEETKEKIWSIQKTNKVADISPKISVITLHVNGLNKLIKRQKLSGLI